jgi:hypothetical protein
MEAFAMMVSHSSRRFLVAMALLWLPVLIHPPPASADGFSAVELPPVETRLGDFTHIDPIGIDNRGRVVGGASLPIESSPGVFGEWAGFRFNPKSGLSSILDPLDGLHTDIWAVNDRGMIFGSVSGRNFNQQKLFLYSDEAGFDFLENGSKKWIRRGFWLHALTDNGNLAGTAPGRSGRHSQALLLYREGQGWLNVWKREEPLPGYVDEFLVNDLGDFALQSYEGVFASLGGSRPERIGPEGFDFSLEALGNRNEVIGAYKRQSRHNWDIGGANRPFVFTPKRGFVDILPDGFKHGSARWISKNGAIRGTATRERGGDTVFRWDPVDDFESVDLKQAFEEGGGERTFRSAKVIDVNDRGQLIAVVRVRPRNITTCWGARGARLFVYFDPRQGFVDLQQAVDEAGLDLRIFEIVDLNDKGHIVVRACHSDVPSPGLPWTGILLRPR